MILLCQTPVKTFGVRITKLAQGQAGFTAPRYYGFGVGPDFHMGAISTPNNLRHPDVLLYGLTPLEVRPSWGPTEAIAHIQAAHLDYTVGERMPLSRFKRGHRDSNIWGVETPFFL